MYVFVCALLYVPGIVYVRGVCEISKQQQQQQYNASRVSNSCVRASRKGKYCDVCAVGAQQKIEPRRHFHVQYTKQTHVVGSHTSYRKQ